MSLPALDAPEPGTVCPDCGRDLVISGFCGACAEHERRRDDPVRLAEQRVLMSLLDEGGR